MFSERLRARRIACATEALMAFVCGLVTSKASGSQEALATTFDVTLMISLICMCALDMLLQVLLFEVSLVTVIVWTYERPLIVV